MKMTIAARRTTGVLALAVLVLSPLLGTHGDSSDNVPQPGQYLPKPRIPPLGLGFDVYCRVCRHVMEVASREVWNFRGDSNAVAARLQDVCTTASDFTNPQKNLLARQACPILHNGKTSEIANVLSNGLGELDDEEMKPHIAAIAICNQVHEACDRHGKAVSVLGDLEKLKRNYKNMQQSTQQQNSAGPSTTPASSGPPKGPPKVDAGTAKKLLKKRTKKTEL